MDREGGSNAAGSCYYAVLGIRKDSSSSDIRAAYRKLALKWHPDRWARNQNAAVAGEANRRFQQIQEAYSVLSDQGKRSLYDAGVYDPLEEEDEVRTLPSPWFGKSSPYTKRGKLCQNVTVYDAVKKKKAYIPLFVRNSGISCRR
ncbi:uncharacterized protein LOC126799196 isoform X2 [Argentina anserina]|uniref:uncharacterized protein LOC126799196 isoform X2 n=1 Tax=Argentina anserina TaxID=57926 RepID=UPI00217686FD|nr:uncharacterized protein LOC126799196 isoform X2 [Potentilla anserina]